MGKWDVARRGTDSSGRGIYASDYMWSWWQGVLSDARIRPFAHSVTITQGAWMSIEGDGADGSAGYHDGGGCFDLRVWNLTDAQVALLILVIRERGAAAWLRNLVHGGFEDPHIHLVLGTDADLDDGAAWQWRDYIGGGDGIGGRDYHRRPSPLVLTPPTEDWFDMATEEDLRKILAEELGKALTQRIGNGRTFLTNIALIAEKVGVKARKD